MITEDYVSLETAKLLKEKGFDEVCDYRYYETHSGFDLGPDPGYTNSHWEDWYKDMGVRNYSAPTLQMAMKWLREVHNIFIDIHSYWHIHKTFSNNGFRVEISCPKLQNEYLEQTFGTYEEACEAAIKYCLESLI